MPFAMFYREDYPLLPTFSLLTFNCYAVPAPGTADRMRMLARTLNDEALSVVCLQEVHTHRYRRLLIRHAGDYPAHAYEPFLHAPKGGLLTLSALPIEGAEYVLYRKRGLWYTPALADWVQHKGILITRLRCGDLPVVVLNTHLTANYLGRWDKGSPFAKQEHHQLMQLAEVVQAQPASALVVVAGDLNIPRGSWLYESFLAASGLHDPLAGHDRPTLHPRRGLPARYFASIDYALYRLPPLPDPHVESRLRLEDRVPVREGRHIHLSDHLAVDLRLSWG